ncbi:MAG: hypothetical protein V3U47_05795 [Acidimicrobiia bacterium]
MTALLDGPVGHQVELDEGEKQALGNLAAAGLVPELRLLKKTGSE